MNAHITRLMTFAQHGQPRAYSGSDMMRADLEALIGQAMRAALATVPAAPALTDALQAARKVIASVVGEIPTAYECEHVVDMPQARKMCAAIKTIDAALAAAPAAQPAASGAVDSQPSPTLPNTWHWVAEQEGVEYVEYHHGYQAPPYAVDVWEPLFTADQMREYAAISRAQAAAQPAEQCDQAFDDWYAAQRHQLTNEQVCRVIWTRGWEARGADNPEMDGTDAAHPAWWRSHDHTFAVMCEKLEKLLDGEPVVGATEPRWQRIRKRIAALVAAQPAEPEAG